MREVHLAIYSGGMMADRRPCRLCGSPSNLAVINGRNEYPYCAACVDTALERAEVTAAASARKEQS